MAKRVLLIEDEPNIIEAISFILSRDGWTPHPKSDRVQRDRCGSEQELQTWQNWSLE